MKEEYILDNMKIVKSLASYGVQWCREKNKKFSLRLLFSEEGCEIQLGFSDKEITKEEAEDLIEKLIKAEEMSYLNRFHNDLNELSVGLSKLENDTIVTIQSKIENKFREVGVEIFPDMFKD